MKNSLLVCALALLTAGMVLAEPTHDFKFTGFTAHVGKTVCGVDIHDGGESPFSDETIIAKSKNDLQNIFMNQEMWGEVEASSWSEFYSILETTFSDGQLVTVPANGEFLLFANGGMEEEHAYCSLIVCPEGLKAGKPYTLYATHSVYELESPGEHVFPAVDFADLMEIESGKLKSDTVPEPAFALVALIGLLAICRKK